MPAAPDLAKVSMTAKMTAYMRQYSDIPLAGDVARAVQAEKAIEQLQADQSFALEDLLWYAPLFEVRYKSVAAQIRKSGLHQVLELASGLSLRGLVMAQQDPNLIYVETDLPGLTEQKIALVTKLAESPSISQNVRPPANHHFSAADALDLDQLKAAAQVFQPGQPIAVVNEGLLQYLFMDELEQVTRNVCALLREFGGVWITPDFAIKHDVRYLSEAQRRFRQAIADETGRELYHDSFENPQQMMAFFEHMGLDVQRLNQLGEAPDLTSVGVLNENTRPLWERIKPYLNLWVLRLKQV
jgi:O-methyltransferase involved in polyketide biosynthesis